MLTLRTGVMYQEVSEVWSGQAVTSAAGILLMVKKLHKAGHHACCTTLLHMAHWLPSWQQLGKLCCVSHTRPQSAIQWHVATEWPLTRLKKVQHLFLSGQVSVCSHESSGKTKPGRSDRDASLEPGTVLVEGLNLLVALVILHISLELVPQAGQSVEGGRDGGPQCHCHSPFLTTCTSDHIRWEAELRCRTE